MDRRQFAAAHHARLIHAKGDRTQIIRKAGTAAIELLEEELLAAQPDK